VKRIKNISEVADLSYNLSVNTIKLNPHNTVDHELAKCLLCLECLSNGINFYTEVIFKNSKRADIYIPILDEAWEIVCSESKKSIEKKIEEYPCAVKVFNAKKIIRLNYPGDDP